MKMLLFWSTWLTLAFFCQTDNQPSELSDEFMNGGHIEVVGDLLISNTGNPEIEVESIQLVGAKTYYLNGCGKDVCSYNITHVAPGVYDITLYGSEGFKVTEREIVE